MMNPLAEVAYQGWQQTKNALSLAHKSLAFQLSTLVIDRQKTSTPAIDPQVLSIIQQRLDALLKVDWDEANSGVYPIELLFEEDWPQFLSTYPQIWFDLPLTWTRKNRKEYHVFPSDVDRSAYPKYYLQNFHHQTDGYLSDRSAELYDLQVDILFNGAADAMRRRVLAPLKQAVSDWETPPKPVKILDVACGTGRTLKFIRHTCPQASLYGIDLSPYYLRKANQLLSQMPGELPQLLQGNGEELPYVDEYFHAITSVFLFHELPYPARQQVIDECFRVLKPGGTLIICDSIQKEDLPAIAPMLNWFSQTFHEPYYKSYLSDDLGDRLQKTGFTKVNLWIAGDFINYELNITGYVLLVVLDFLWITWYGSVALIFFFLSQAGGELVIGYFRRKYDKTDTVLIRSFADLTSFIVAVLVILFGVQRLGVNLFPLLAGLGVGGVAIALGAQSTLENVIAGLALFFDKPVVAGEDCVFGDNEGTIESIGLRSVRLQGVHGNVMSMPNSAFSQLKLTNKSRSEKSLFKHRIHLQYQTTSEQLKSVLAEFHKLLVYHEHTLEAGLHVRCVRYNEYSIVVELQAYIDTGDEEQFLFIQEGLLLRVKKIIEQVGTKFAIGV